MDNKNISSGTIARTIALALALINQALVIAGKPIINIAEQDIYNSVSLIATIVASLWAWWKNNSFTKEAIEADAYMADMKAGK